MPWVCPNFVISTWWPQESQRRGLPQSSDRVLWARLCVTSPLSSIHHDPTGQFPLLSHAGAFVRHLLCVSTYCVSARMRLRKLQSHRWQGPLSQGSMLEGQRALFVSALLAELSLSPPSLCVNQNQYGLRECLSGSKKKKTLCEAYLRSSRSSELPPVGTSGHHPHRPAPTVYPITRIPCRPEPWTLPPLVTKVLNGGRLTAGFLPWQSLAWDYP